MREIKFRYFFTDSTEKLHVLTEDIKEIEFHTDIPDNIKRGCELMARTEFTGLFDKQGKEIYEGDIVKCNFKNLDNTPYSVNGFVEWFEPNAGFIINKVDFGIDQTNLFCLEDMIDSFQIEVIGNIYEGVYW